MNRASYIFALIRTPNLSEVGMQRKYTAYRYRYLKSLRLLCKTELP